MVKIKAIDGSKPHPNYNGWNNFLKKYCEVRGKAQGVIHYGCANCNYILFPCGTLIKNHGYHGKTMMGRIRKGGRVKILTEAKIVFTELKKFLENRI